MEEQQKVDTEYGRYKLFYELTRSQFLPEEDDGYYYGMRIWQYKEEETMPYDYNEVLGITSSLHKAKELFIQMVEGIVMPITLYDIVDDWLSAFRPIKRILA